MRVCFTIDMGPDAGSNHSTYRGVVEGTPPLLTLLAEERVPATFFVTGEIVRRFANIVRQIADWGHEIGLLGDDEHRFSQLPESDIRGELHVGASLSRRFYRVISYRAMGMEPSDKYLSLLEAEDFLIDSSLAKYRASYWSSPRPQSSLLRVPVSISPATLRLPGMLRSPLLRVLSSPVVLDLQPWEFVDHRMSDAPFADRFRTGEPALSCLRSTIRFFKDRGAVFLRLEDLLPQDELTVEVLNQAEASRAVA